MSEKSNSSNQQIQISLFWKILLATLFASLIPLIWVSYSSIDAIEEIGETAKELTSDELDSKSIEALRVRAEQTATRISSLLDMAVSDAEFLATHLPRTAESYLLFNESRQSDIVFGADPQDDFDYIIHSMPLYREITFIDLDGQEVIRIVDGELVPQADLRNVSNPANTTYKTETYLSAAKELTPWEVYVSPVMAWYTEEPAQPAQGADSSTSKHKYIDYEAVIRFAKPVYENDERIGVVVLSLDHRHIMEYINRIKSTSGKVFWPDYASGNYAYAIDYEGWLIAHPDLSALRGLDSSGEWMPTTTNETLSEGKTLPLNMLLTNIKDGIPSEIAQNILSGSVGSKESLTRQGVIKVDVYVPIKFSEGAYQDGGVFGGVIISENKVWVERAGEISEQAISEAQSRVLRSIVLIIVISIIILLTATILISRNIMDPIRKLTEAARIMEKGELDVDTLDRLLQRRIDDEVGELTRVFKQMAEAVQLRERRLKEEVIKLRIQIDTKKRDEEVAGITESEYFQDLQRRAKEMRAKRAERNE